MRVVRKQKIEFDQYANGLTLTKLVVPINFRYLSFKRINEHFFLFYLSDNSSSQTQEIELLLSVPGACVPDGADLGRCWVIVDEHGFDWVVFEVTRWRG